MLGDTGFTAEEQRVFRCVPGNGADALPGSDCRAAPGVSACLTLMRVFDDFAYLAIESQSACNISTLSLPLRAGVGI